MNIIVLQNDYRPVSLSRPIKIVEVPVLDIRVVEGIEAVMVEVEEDEIVGIMVEEEEIIGILECDT